MAAQHRQLAIQYLGVPGSTHECVQAMVTILTSPYPCREITVLFCREHEHPYPEEQHYAVSFVVWDWLGTEVTIVPDGFGTHGGTGGWGLAVVLALIEFLHVRLNEKWIEDVEQFERINYGCPTNRDLKDLHQADYWAPSWRLHIRDFGPYLWEQAGASWCFPYWLLEPELWECVKGIEDDPDSAVFRAVRQLEVTVRELAGLDARVVGQDVINQTMGKDAPFPPQGATESEVNAWTNLFRGVIGAFKNPQSHRHVKLTIEDATAQVLTVNLLMRKLKADYRDKFPREDETEVVEDAEDTEDTDEVEATEETGGVVKAVEVGVLDEADETDE